jgi:hypothetical protein
MEDEQKTKEQLINDVAAMRLKITELEKSHSGLIHAEEVLSQSLEKLRKATDFIINILAVAV